MSRDRHVHWSRSRHVAPASRHDTSPGHLATADMFAEFSTPASWHTWCVAHSTSAMIKVIRDHCLALPEVNERLSHGAPTFFVRDQRSFVTVWTEGHHESHVPQLWCACDAQLRTHLVEDRPENFFLPPYVAHRGWIGVRIVATSDLEETKGLLEYAYRLVAPASLVKLLD